MDGAAHDLQELPRESERLSAESRKVRHVRGTAHAVVSHENITKRRQAEGWPQTDQQWLAAILGASRDGILVEDGERILYVNEAYSILLGYDGQEEIIGRHVSEIISPDDAEWMLSLGRHRLRGGGATADAYEFRGRRKDGALIDLEASVSTAAVEGKTYIITAVRDVRERKRAEEALRNSESRYRALVEQASDGIHTYDLRGNFIETNSKLCEMLGYTREELLRLNVADLVPPEDLAAAPIRYDRLQAGETVLTERRLLRRDGTLLPVEISGRMIRGGVLQAIIRDTTERKRAEEALQKAHDELEKRVRERTADLTKANELLRAEVARREQVEQALRSSERGYRLLFERNLAGVYRSTPAGSILECNQSLVSILGYDSKEELLSRPAAEHYYDSAARASFIAQLRKRGTITNFEKSLRRKDGSPAWVLENVTLVKVDETSDEVLEGTVVDITELKRAEEARTHLRRRLITAQEEERHRIARELHDRTGQYLTALTLELKSLESSSEGRSSTINRVKKLRELTDQLAVTVHNLAWKLRPTALDDFGLQTALYNYAEQWSEVCKIPVNFRSIGLDGQRLPPDIETTIYRVVQEALNNVLKHAQARGVSLILMRNPNDVVAVVEDDGRGFDVVAVANKPAGECGLGLLGMKERVALAGGTINIESAPGGGTGVFVRIPSAPAGSERTGRE